jgi:hypothetical protein
MTPAANVIRSDEGERPAAPTPARVAVIYYSATGNVHRLAHAVAAGAEAEGFLTERLHREGFECINFTRVGMTEFELHSLCQLER